MFNGPPTFSEIRDGVKSSFKFMAKKGSITKLYLLNEKKYKSNQIAFGGDSAGGNLALVALLKLIYVYNIKIYLINFHVVH